MSEELMGVPAERPVPDLAHASRDDVVRALFRAHYAGLVRLARLLVDDVETAEDVVQEAFAGLHRRWLVVRDPQAALAYLRTSVVNGSRSGLRRRDVARRHQPPPPPPLPSAESEAVARDEQRRVAAAVRALPLRQRQVIVLRYYLDLSEAQIADVLRISRGAVKSHASRGMSALSDQLEATA